MEHTFSKQSLERLNTCDAFLRTLAKQAIKRSIIDFGISEGYRSPTRQNELYNMNTEDFTYTTLDGFNKLSKHNYKPSKAFDIYAYVNGKRTYEEKYMYYLAGIFSAIAKEMDIEIRWGGNWNSNGDFNDQKFMDLPHFELL